MGRLWIIRGGGHMPNSIAEAHSTKDLGCELRTVVTDKSFEKPECWKMAYTVVLAE